MGKVAKLGWYWHRLWAMNPAEVVLRLQKKAYQFSDSRYTAPARLPHEPRGKFPKLPDRTAAPPELLEDLRESAREILAGKWLAFGHLPLQVDDPPKWQFDYLVGKEFQSAKTAFKLDHRAQPGGADIKIIWEPSRWSQLVRLAMAAWLLDDAAAREKCIQWLHDWSAKNPPFTGLNWTSGLEVGLRLVQFTWIDALLAAAEVPNKTLKELREAILPPHIWYAWRYKSFGSSANNHLLGELAGLVTALARWPQLAQLSAPLKEVAGLFEREVQLQFAPDGGNNEQALGYHLFSWEFCWQCAQALNAAGQPVSPRTQERLRKAGEFYIAVKPEGDPWDFGDSDNAWVTPLFADERQAAAEWWRWFADSSSSPALHFWLGDFGGKRTSELNRWRVFRDSGYAVLETEDWQVRFDLSPLGYLSMAPHGHLDALHLSIWHRGVPVIIDPGTGAYYADKLVREYLADWAAHNSPHLKNPPEKFPRRFGTFLWGGRHPQPTIGSGSNLSITGELELPYGRISRTVTFLPESNAVRIRDSVVHTGGPSPVLTRWKFAPGFAVNDAGAGEYVAASGASSIRLKTSSGWEMARIYNPPEELRGKSSPTASALGSVPLDALVSPAFRRLAAGAYLALESSGEGPFELTISPG